MPLIPVAKDAASTAWTTARSNPLPAATAGVLLVGSLLYAGSVTMAQDPNAIIGMSPAGMDPMMLVYSVAIQAVVVAAGAITAWSKARTASVEALQAVVATRDAEILRLKDEKSDLRVELVGLKIQAQAAGLKLPGA